jgi:hypothetical protein
MKLPPLKNFSRLPFLIGMVILFAIAGCKTDECELVDCLNGACIEGVCACEAGYEGKSCNSESRTRFLGEWEVGDICRGTAIVYNVTVTQAATPQAVTIDNLNAQGMPVSAAISGTEMNIPKQTFGLAVISGSGGIDTLARVISLEYLIEEDGLPDEICQAAFRTP